LSNHGNVTLTYSRCRSIHLDCLHAYLDRLHAENPNTQVYRPEDNVAEAIAAYLNHREPREAQTRLVSS
jgi:hypothetical protein